MTRCVLCGEPIREPARVNGGLCVICAHRTTLSDRTIRRPTGAGIIDME